MVVGSWEKAHECFLTVLTLLCTLLVPLDLRALPHTWRIAEENQGIVAYDGFVLTSTGNVGGQEIPADLVSGGTV